MTESSNHRYKNEDAVARFVSVHMTGQNLILSQVSEKFPPSPPRISHCPGALQAVLEKPESKISQQDPAAPRKYKHRS